MNPAQKAAQEIASLRERLLSRSMVDAMTEYAKTMPAENEEDAIAREWVLTHLPPSAESFRDAAVERVCSTAIRVTKKLAPLPEPFFWMIAVKILDGEHEVRHGELGIAAKRRMDDGMSIEEAAAEGVVECFVWASLDELLRSHFPEGIQVVHLNLSLDDVPNGTNRDDVFDDGNDVGEA